MARRGVISVPLFSAPYTLPAQISGNAFRRLSWWPQLNGGFAVNGNPTNIGIINTMFAAVPGPAQVLSEYTFGTPNSGVGGIFMGQSIDQGNLAISTPSENVFAQTPMPPTNGIQNNLVSLSKFVNQPVFGNGLGNIIPYDNSAREDATQPFFDYNAGAFGGPYAGLIAVRTGTMLSGQVYQRQSNSIQNQDMFDIGIPWATLLTNTFYYQCPAQNGITYGLFDPNGATSPVVPRQIASYISQAFTGSSKLPLQNYTPVFDDPTLQNVWNGLGGAYTIDIWKGGWIVKLGTAGTGPTGQPEEIAICDPAMATYNLLRFLPQDNAAQTQFNHASTFGWQVKIDPNGVLYFNSGNPSDAAHILYSYSPTQFLYPQFAYTPGLITLPCYTPCDAVTTYDD